MLNLACVNVNVGVSLCVRARLCIRARLCVRLCLSACLSVCLSLSLSLSPSPDNLLETWMNFPNLTCESEKKRVRMDVKALVAQLESERLREEREQVEKARQAAEQARLLQVWSNPIKLHSKANEKKKKKKKKKRKMMMRGIGAYTDTHTPYLHAHMLPLVVSWQPRRRQERQPRKRKERSRKNSSRKKQDGMWTRKKATRKWRA